MRKKFSILLALIMALTVFALPDVSSAAAKAPGKVSAKTIKMTVVSGNSLKFAWGTAKTGKKVLKSTCYQVEYKVELMQDNGKYKTTTNWKSLKKGKKRYHVYKGTKGCKYRVSLRVRAYNGKKFGKWSATRAKAKKIVKTIPAFAPKYAAFNPGLAQVSENRSITESPYLNTQGCVFDTYTKEDGSLQDGYNFSVGSTDETKNEIAMFHFYMDEQGNIDKDNAGPVIFSTANLGHANDGTIYKAGNNQYLFVAVSGGTEKATKDYKGNSIKLAYLNLNEVTDYYAQQNINANPDPADPAAGDQGGTDPNSGDQGGTDQGGTDQNGGDQGGGEPSPSVTGQSVATPATPKVYGAQINTNGVKMSNTLANCAFSGITYTGNRKVSGTDRQVFVLKDGRTFYAAYLTISNGVPKFTFFDSARINKPVIKYSGKTYDATTQGITYHNGYLYLSYSGESNKVIWCNMLLGRMTYADMFRDAYGDLRNLQICSKRITTCKVNGVDTALAKHIPEAVFFRTLNGTGNLFLSVNRGTTASSGSDIDAVLKSDVLY